MVYTFNNLSLIFCDAPYPNQVGFKDPATPVMDGILYLHDYIWIFLVFIMVFVSWILVRTLIIFKENNLTSVVPTVQNVPLEVAWALIPAVFLSVTGGGDHISHLYSSEEILSPPLDIVITGNQWFWIYEFMVFARKISIESHMIESDSFMLRECRNIEFDKRLVLPVNTNIRLIATRNDVIRGIMYVPSPGIEVDSVPILVLPAGSTFIPSPSIEVDDPVPGRTNTGTLYIEREGRYWGIGYEAWGKDSLTPIFITAVSIEKYNIYSHSLNIKSYSSIKHYSNKGDLNESVESINYYFLIPAVLIILVGVPYILINDYGFINFICFLGIFIFFYLFGIF